MSDFTPGPWLLDDGNGRWTVTCPQRGFEDVPDVRGRVCEVAYRPNAALIAAAPEMFDALGAAANELEWQLERGNGSDVTRAALSIVNAAISKAQP